MIFLVIILILVPIILIVALFSRKGMQTEAAIDINKPQRQVFDYLINMKNQVQYNVWLKEDPTMQKHYTCTDGQPGFILAWESKNKKVGKASQQITSITKPEKIAVELTFEKPVRSKAHYWFELTPINDTQTHVTWKYEGNTSPYYVLRVLLILLRLKKKTTNYMQLSLKNLKAILEK